MLLIEGLGHIATVNERDRAIVVHFQLSAKRRPALSFDSHVIRDRGEMLNLTDMWRAAGADPSKRPANWARHDATVEFVEHLRGNVFPEHIEPFQTDRGGADPGTWAHWQIGLAYAKYLSPDRGAAARLSAAFPTMGVEFEHDDAAAVALAMTGLDVAATFPPTSSRAS